MFHTHRAEAHKRYHPSRNSKYKRIAAPRGHHIMGVKEIFSLSRDGLIPIAVSKDTNTWRWKSILTSL